MKPLILISLLALSFSLCSQNTEKASIKNMIIEQNKDTLETLNSDGLLGKLNKYKQRADSSYPNSSIIGLTEKKDPNIDLLIQDYIEHKKFKGYRIQIFASTIRLEALKVRAEFLKKYPNEESYLIYQAPNFKVRVGNYQDRLITHEHLAPIEVDFPSAFIVKDEIEPSLD